MNYLKFTQYVYLAAAVFFIYIGITRALNDEPGYWIWFAIALMAVFMFFFRRKFAKKFEDHDRNSKP